MDGNRLIGRAGLWAFTGLAALFFLLPLYVMVATSLKTMPEVRDSSIFALPLAPTIGPWVEAWSHACSGQVCEGLKAGFWNSVIITVPSVLLSVLIGAVNGYALALWRARFAEAMFAIMLVGAFIPYQLFIYPLALSFSAVGLNSSLPGVILVHVIFGMPVTTLIFRNFYSGIPVDLMNAARVDGAGFWRIFGEVILPMSTPIIVVAVILQATGIWNDYLFGLIFAGREHQPMTVQLMGLVNTRMGERPYNVHMAATLLTGIVPLAIYLLSGRWFVRGIAAGAVKG
ncbi:carbohydrate ABC transporter permease [Mangrovicoccus sp. HB161399]|uniref:carbohydrate ABC transporter permease n=1 Tax=Mangrovicoccus sp. HB161399 TaxID=2720392 RepID=UPI001557040D|nr:carbohydrate ABC transporter permease [Mangrovicoccus sp. HB161399]